MDFSEMKKNLKTCLRRAQKTISRSQEARLEPSELDFKPPGDFDGRGRFNWRLPGCTFECLLASGQPLFLPAPGPAETQGPDARS